MRRNMTREEAKHEGKTRGECWKLITYPSTFEVFDEKTNMLQKIRGKSKGQDYEQRDKMRESKRGKKYRREKRVKENEERMERKGKRRKGSSRRESEGKKKGKRKEIIREGKKASPHHIYKIN